MTQKQSRAKWVVLAFATAIVVLAGAAVFASSQGDDEHEEPSQKLGLPKRLVDKYRLHSVSDSVPRGDGGWASVDIKDWKAVTGKYAVALDQPNIDGVEISGMYGDVAQPDRVRDVLLRGAAGREDSVLAVRPEEFVIDAAGPEWSCQVVVRGEGPSKTTLPVCAWADSSTAGTVLFLSPEYMTEPPAQVDLDHAARDAHAMREEIRKPVK